MTDLLTREFVVELREEADSREVVGLAVPFGQIIKRYDAQYGTEYERFEPGSVEEHPDGCMYFYGHTEPIGLVLEGSDVEGGHEIRSRISDTQRGNEVRTLLKDRVLTKHSIGFEPVEARVDKVRLSDDGPEVDVLTRTKVLRREVSVVPFPAYSGADITEVRDREPASRKEHPVPESTDVLTRADLKEVNEHLTTIDRQLSVIEGGGGQRADEFTDLREFRSHGEFVKGLVSGETRDHVEVLNRAYAGNGVAQVDEGTAPTWIDRDIKLVEQKRPIVNLFNRESLPSVGMTLEYPKFDSKSGDVAEQEEEGEDLTFMKLKITKDSTDVHTYGGAVELSKQVIDRYPASYINKVLQMMKISYAKISNAGVRAQLLGATGINNVINISASNTKAASYVGAMVDATAAIESESLGLSLDFVLCNAADFKRAAIVTDQAERLQFSISGAPGSAVNAVGGLNVKALTIDVGGVPWILDPRMAANVDPRACSAEALTYLESPGAPFSLTDENIINLTEAFSLYGYGASTLDDPKGIQPIKVATGTTV